MRLLEFLLLYIHTYILQRKLSLHVNNTYLFSFNECEDCMAESAVFSTSRLFTEITNILDKYLIEITRKQSYNLICHVTKIRLSYELLHNL